MRDYDRRPLIAPARRRHRRKQRRDDLGNDRNRYQRAGADVAHAAVAQNRRQPAEDAIGERRLQTHEERHLPCQRIRPDAAQVHVLAGARFWRVIQPGAPRDHRRQHRKYPGRERPRPGACHQLAERNGQARGQGGAARQRHRVDARHQGRRPREVLLDERRQQHVDDADGDADQSRADQQGGHRAEAAHEQADGEHGQEQKHHPLAAHPARDERRERPEEAKAQDRRGRQQAGARSGEAGIAHDLRQYRSHAGQRRPQVERDEDQADDEKRTIAHEGCSVDDRVCIADRLHRAQCRHARQLGKSQVAVRAAAAEIRNRDQGAFA